MILFLMKQQHTQYMFIDIQQQEKMQQNILVTAQEKANFDNDTLYKVNPKNIFDFFGTKLRLFGIVENSPIGMQLVPRICEYYNKIMVEIANNLNEQKDFIIEVEKGKNSVGLMLIVMQLVESRKNMRTYIQSLELVDFNLQNYTFTIKPIFASDIVVKKNYEIIKNTISIWESHQEYLMERDIKSPETMNTIRNVDTKIFNLQFWRVVNDVISAIEKHKVDKNMRGAMTKHKISTFINQNDIKPFRRKIESMIKDIFKDDIETMVIVSDDEYNNIEAVMIYFPSNEEQKPLFPNNNEIIVTQ